MSSVEIPVETTVEERRILRRAAQLIVKERGHIYVDANGFTARVSKKLVAALEAKGLITSVGAGFSRTPAGDQALGVSK